MNIKERIENEIKRIPNSKTVNMNFTHEQVYKMLSELKLRDDIDFKTFANAIYKKVMESNKAHTNALYGKSIGK